MYSYRENEQNIKSYKIIYHITFYGFKEYHEYQEYLKKLLNRFLDKGKPSSTQKQLIKRYDDLNLNGLFFHLLTKW